MGGDTSNWLVEIFLSFSRDLQMGDLTVTIPSVANTRGHTFLAVLRFQVQQ